MVDRTLTSVKAPSSDGTVVGRSTTNTGSLVGSKTAELPPIWVCPKPRQLNAKRWFGHRGLASSWYLYQTCRWPLSGNFAADRPRITFRRRRSAFSNPPWDGSGKARGTPRLIQHTEDSTHEQLDSERPRSVLY